MATTGSGRQERDADLEHDTASEASAAGGAAAPGDPAADLDDLFERVADAVDEFVDDGGNSSHEAE